MKPKQQNILILAVIVIVLAIVVIVIATHGRKVQAPSSASPKVSAAVMPKYGIPPITVSQLTAAKSNSDFPSNFPSEAGSQVVHASQVTVTATNQTQTLRTVTTAKTLPAALKVYQTYFAKNGWKILSTTDTPTLTGISASKNTQQIDIVISYDASVKSNIVVTSLTEPSAAK